MPRVGPGNLRTPGEAGGSPAGKTSEYGMPAIGVRALELVSVEGQGRSHSQGEAACGCTWSGIRWGP